MMFIVREVIPPEEEERKAGTKMKKEDQE